MRCERYIHPQRPYFELVFVVYRVIYAWFIWPLLLSPLRVLPGPPLGHPILGQIPTVIKSESGIPHREWVKKYGPVVRVVGPIGMERVIFMKPEALQQVLVKDWLEYPRVSRGLFAVEISVLTASSQRFCDASLVW